MKGYKPGKPKFAAPSGMQCIYGLYPSFSVKDCELCKSSCKCPHWKRVIGHQRRIEELALDVDLDAETYE